MPKELFSESTSVIDVVRVVVGQILGSGKAESLYEVLEKWISAGRFILLLDGVDEIPVESRVRVSKWIQECFDRKACLLATSRVVGYQIYPVHAAFKDNKKSSQTEPDLSFSNIFMKKNFFQSRSKQAIEEDSVDRVWAEIRYLMPFDQAQISDFARNWYRQRCTSDKDAKSKTSDLLAALRESTVTAQLARTPNLLSLMAIVHRERAHLPDGKALLYDEIVNAYINTIDSQRSIMQGDVLSRYSWREKKNWLSFVGFMMQSTAKRGKFAAGGIVTPQAKVLSWLESAMRQSGVDFPDTVAIEFLDWVARRSGLLLPRGEGLYAFVHLSFQEYFCACYLENCVVSPEFFSEKRKNQVKVSDFISWSEASSWVETLVFLFEILSNERTADWAVKLGKAIFLNGPKREPLYGEQASLATRLLGNKHVKLSPAWADQLASIASYEAWRMWDSRIYPAPLTALLASGYAVLVDDYENEKNFFPLVSQAPRVLDKSRVMIYLYRSRQPLTNETLKAYPNLVAIYCCGAEFIDFGSENIWTELQSVSIFESVIHGAEVLGSMKYLKTLELVKVKQRGLELSLLSRSLTSISINGVNLQHLGFLSKCTNLEMVEISGVKVSDSTVFRKLKRIEYLTLDRTEISELDFLSGLSNLTYLRVANCPVRSIPPVNSIFITTISLEKIPLDSLAFVSGMPRLIVCVVEDCPIESLQDVELNNTRFLHLINLPLKNLTGLEGFKNIQTLALRDMEIDGFFNLSALPSLDVLRLDAVNIDDLEWIAGARNLRHLVLMGSLIKDVKPLKKLKKLRILEIDNVGDLDVSILKSPRLSLQIREGDDKS